ncbi:hypothetical protein KSC_004310 [Ktedonobacter sp. SOSP1-52]|uniref:hypothetical protein n=1 Tax=Ktedonobacter sp. SOSP1-52 TaxID=2778366 RepID=UPI001916B2A8|nr:hypothetical protein [Ktedonobacter sp. SOSP1-52]GHO61539.1 hypothetical protein KSC_004310 [Ktedonobacter sp. SOSP1-52]
MRVEVSLTLPDQEHRGVFPSETRAQVTAQACSLPRTQGVPLARWSRSELARLVASAPELPSVSVSTIGRWLREERIRPWRYHCWQHIQNPEVFLQRARPVLQFYAQAKALLKKGVWLVCSDEKTSLQA